MAEFDPDNHRDTVYQAVRNALAEWLTRIRDAILNHTTNTVRLDQYPERGTWRNILGQHVAELLARLWQWAYRLRQTALNTTTPDGDYADTTPGDQAQRAADMIIDTLAAPGGTPTTLRNLIRSDLNTATGRVTARQLVARIEALLTVDGPDTQLRNRRTDLEAIIDDPDSTPEQRRRARADLTELETGIRVEDHQWDAFLRRITHDLIHTARNHADVEAAHTWTEATGEELVKTWLCVTGDTLVDAAHVTHAARRWHEGQIIMLRTASGRRVSVTPQHPILTDRGWRAAQEVNAGDNVVTVGDTDAIGTPNVKDNPAFVGDLIDAALDCATPAGALRVMRRGVDLDSDTFDSDVEVVRADWELRNRLLPNPPQPFYDFTLETSDRRLGDLSAAGSPDKSLVAKRRTQTSGSNPLGLVGPMLIRLSGGSQHPGATLIADVDALFAEDPSHGGRRTAMLLRQLRLGRSSDVLLRQGGCIDVIPATNSHAQSLSFPCLPCSLWPLRKAPAHRTGCIEELSPITESPPHRACAARQGFGDLLRCFTLPVSLNHGFGIQVGRRVGLDVAPVFSEYRHNEVTADAMRVGDGVGAEPAIERSENRVGVDPRPGGHLVRLALSPNVDPEPSKTRAYGARSNVIRASQASGASSPLIRLDQVVNVDITQFSGHVYDLSTMNGWFCANSIIVHNSTSDPRVRPSHVEADGDSVPVADPFTVGGARLSYPGDPSAPISERARCRCTLLFETPEEAGLEPAS